MKLQPFLVLVLVLVSLPSLAQQASTSGDSPYAPRAHAYTSRDNPYAPGGIYDPYRSGRTSATGLGRNSASSLESSDEDVGGADLERPPACTDSHLASDVSASRRADGSNRLGFGNSTKSINSLNRPSTDGYGAVSHCAAKSLAAGPKRSIRKPGLGMNNALSGNLPK